MAFDIKQFLTENKITLNELTEEEKYIDSIIGSIHGKRIGRWKLSFEPMVGSWAWVNPQLENLVVHATPMWEGTKGIAVSVTDDEGGYKTYRPLPFKLSGSLKKDASEYLRQMERWFRGNAGNLETWNEEGIK